MSTRTEPKKGRPATGRTRRKISVSIPEVIAAAAAKTAAKKGESLSQYISRATQTLLMNDL